jgi:hypothetical protein
VDDASDAATVVKHAPRTIGLFTSENARQRLPEVLLPEPAAPKAKKKPTETKGNDTGPANGEEVVVHSLVSRPEFNGCVGVISGDAIDGRYPVKLPSRDTKIAIKPTNFNRLGVFVVERANKARKFECLEHASRICSK